MRGIDPGVFNGLQAEQDILTSQWLAILEMRISAQGESIGQSVLADLRSCCGELRTQLQGLRLTVEETVENGLQDTRRAAIVTRQGIQLLGITEHV